LPPQAVELELRQNLFSDQELVESFVQGTYAFGKNVVKGPACHPVDQWEVGFGKDYLLKGFGDKPRSIRIGSRVDRGAEHDG
jgi:hypothetical protein